MSFCYAVRKGRQVGIFNTWDEAKVHVQGFSGAEHHKFKTRMEADWWLHNDLPVQKCERMPSPIPMRAALKPSHRGPTVAFSLPPGTLKIYTDGAAPDNGTPACRAGVGIFVGHGDLRNISMRLDPKHYRQTNQVISIYFIVSHVTRTNIAHRSPKLPLRSMVCGLPPI